VAPKKILETKKDRVHAARILSDDSESDEFHDICMRVFQNADTNHNGRLDREEFFTVLRSPSLGLNLSIDEIKQIYDLIDVDHDGDIVYAEFVPVLKKVLQRVYQQISLDWNDWCHITDEVSGDSFYLNKRTGEMSKQKPHGFNPDRKEVRTFQYVNLNDGTEVTTYVDSEGKRVYLDWEDEVRTRFQCIMKLTFSYPFLSCQRHVHI
jgi:hypothetical protein